MSRPNQSHTIPERSGPYHRIAVVRRQQGISLRSAARKLGTEPSMLRGQESASADLWLSELYQWQEVLQVPIAELLVESEAPLSRPVMERAQMVRLMKTAAYLVENAQALPLRRMAENLVQQLLDMMPELAEIASWHSVGQRRAPDEYGAAYDRRLPDDAFQRRGGE